MIHRFDPVGIRFYRFADELRLGGIPERCVGEGDFIIEWAVLGNEGVNGGRVARQAELVE
jgi:hypothetical protein